MSSLKYLFILLFILTHSLYAATINGTTYKIQEVEYIINGTDYIQVESGTKPVSVNYSTPVYIKKVTLDNGTVLDNFATNDISVTLHADYLSLSDSNKGVVFNDNALDATNANAESALNTTNIKDYVSNDDESNERLIMDITYNGYYLESDDYIFYHEREGNNEFKLQALDISGNPIGDIVVFPETSNNSNGWDPDFGIGGPFSPYQHPWMGVIKASDFGVSQIYGLRQWTAGADLKFYAIGEDEFVSPTCLEENINETILIGKYENGGIAQLDWNASTKQASNETLTTSNQNGFWDLAYNNDGKLYATITGSELLEINPLTKQIISNKGMIAGSNNTYESLALVSDKNGLLYSITSYNNRAAVVTFSADAPNNTTLVAYVDNIGSISTYGGDLAWSNGYLYWTVTIANQVRLIQIDVLNGSMVSNKVITHSNGNTFSSVAIPMFNDSKGNLVLVLGTDFYAVNTTSAIVTYLDNYNYPTGTPTGGTSSHDFCASETEKKDYGDAPEEYPHVSHIPSDNLYLGDTKPDTENNQQSSSDASGDGSDDSDGVTIPPTLFIENSNYDVPVKVFNNSGQNAYITAWIDFDRNGIFEEYEAINTNNLVIPSSSSSQTVTIQWSNSYSPKMNNLTVGNTIMRIRLTTSRVYRCDSEHYANGTSYENNYFVSPDGEIEDYEISIKETPIPGSCTTDGLLAYWSFNEGSGTKAFDEHNSYDMTLYNSPSWTTGIDGTALQFNDDDYVEPSDHNDLSTSSYTVSLWAKLDSNSCPSTTAIFEQNRWRTGHVGMYINGGSCKPQLRNGSHYFSAEEDMSDGDWHHLVFTYDQSSQVAKIYVDGNLKETATGVSHQTGTDKPTRIGGNNDDSETFPGKLDEVRVYERALDITEISELFSTPGCANEPPPASCSIGTAGTGNYVAGWWHNSPDNTPTSNRYWESYPNDIKSGKDDTVISQAFDETHGSGIQATIAGSHLSMEGVDQSTLEGAISDNDYVEYKFTTANFTGNKYISRYVFTVANGHQVDYYPYKFSILVSDQANFSNHLKTLTDAQQQGYTSGQPDNPNTPGSHQTYEYNPTEFILLEPNKTYTIRIYVYDDQSSGNNGIRLDDFNFGVDCCGGCDTTPELIVEYRFDECDFTNLKVKDSSGNNFDGNIEIANRDVTGTIVSSESEKIINRAAKFEEGIITKDLGASTLNFNDGENNTVSFWIKWNGSTLSDGYNWGASLVSWGEVLDRYSFFIKNDGQLGFNTGNADILGVDYTSYAHEWHHIVAVFNNGDITKSKLYIDGTLQTLTQSGTPIPSRANIRSKVSIAGKTDSPIGHPHYHFKDYMDEIKIYNGELNSTKVSQIYTNELAGRNWDGTSRLSTNCGSPTSLSILDSRVLEGDSGTTNLTFSVTLDQVSDSSISFDYQLFDGNNTVEANATSPSDYVNNGSVTNAVLSANTQSYDINILVNGDTDIEEDEQFTIIISNLQGATLGNASAIGTIINDDVDLDADDDGILDSIEKGSQSIVYSAGWYNNSPSGTFNQDGYCTNIDNDTHVYGSNDSTIIKTASPFTLGGGIIDNTGGNSQRILTDVASSTLAEAKIGNKYIEYTFETADTLANHTVLDKFAMANSDEEGAYYFSIEFSSDNFVTTTRLISDFHISSTHNRSPFFAISNVTSTKILSPSTTYKFRVYIYGATNSSTRIMFDDLNIGFSTLKDSDNDTIPDYLDLDSDNDGIPDNVEAQTTQGYIPPNKIFTNEGVDTAYASLVNGGLTPINTDGTDEVDYLDLDSDNDGVFDIIESGFTVISDSDNDGRANGNVGNNGIYNHNLVETDDSYSDVNAKSHDGTNFNLQDSDNDTNINGSNATPTTQDFDYRDTVALDPCSGFPNNFVPRENFSDIFVVTNTNNEGAGSLREAILNTNANTSATSIKPNGIRFCIDTVGSHQTIPLLKLGATANALHALKILEPTVVDAWSQGIAGYNGTPLITIDASPLLTELLPSTTAPLHIQNATSSGSEIRGLNVINYTATGIYMYNTSNIRIRGSWVGIDVNGLEQTNIINLTSGAFQSHTVDQLILGGANPEDRNIGSGSSNGALLMSTTNSVIQGNYFGTNPTGLSSVKNTQNGVYLLNTSTDNYIHDNLISGNEQRGIVFNGATIERNLVTHNKIGVDITGNSALSNQEGIVFISASNNEVGTSNIANKNIISGNTRDGVYLQGTATGNLIQNNLIGVGEDNQTNLGNAREGVRIISNDNTILSNIIAYNQQGGIGISTTGIRNKLSKNIIYNNVGLGIDLDLDDVTANDGLINTAKGNSNLDYPIFTNASYETGLLKLQGYVGIKNNPISGSYEIELFQQKDDGDNLGEVELGDGLNIAHGEANQYLLTFTTNSDGTFNTSISTSISLNKPIVATARDILNNTSEFSAPISISLDLDTDDDGILDIVEYGSCTEGVETLIAFEDFGTGNRTSTSYSTYCYEDGTGSSSCTNYSGNINVNDGEYAIVQHANPDASQFGVWTTQGDHTANPNGRMMVVNASLEADEFYRHTFSVIPNAPLTVDLWILNILNVGVNQTFPNVSFHLETLDGTQIGQMLNTGDILQDATWNNYSLSINPEENSQVQIVLQNNAPGGGGNDLALDDITIKQVLCDSDNDTVPDYLDLDSDNDGIPDNIEAQTTQDYIKPNRVFDEDGVDTAYNGGLTTTVDTDGDNMADYLDVDSDNDNIFDINESGLGNNDTNNDGRTNADVGINGLDNGTSYEHNDSYIDVNGLAYENLLFNLQDSDGDMNQDGLNAAPLGLDFDYRDNIDDPLTITVNNLEKLEGDDEETEFTIPLTLSRPAPTGGITINYSPSGEEVYTDDFAQVDVEHFFKENPNPVVDRNPNPNNIEIHIHKWGKTHIDEGNSGTEKLKFLVKLNKRAPEGGVQVNIGTRNITATEGEDFTKTTSSVYFEAGEKWKIVSYLINGDTTLEENEEFEVYIHSPINARLHKSHIKITATIKNDDTDNEDSSNTTSYKRYWSSWNIYQFSYWKYSTFYSKKYNSYETYYIEELNMTPNSKYPLYNKAIQKNSIQQKDTVDTLQQATTASEDVEIMSTYIKEGETEGNITMLIQGDISVEDNEAFNLSLSSPDDVLFIVDDNISNKTSLSSKETNSVTTTNKNNLKSSLKTTTSKTIIVVIINDDNLTDALVADYRFDECYWDGTNNEVIDNSGNDLHGTALNSANTIVNGKIQRAGYFTGTGAAVSVPDDAQLQPETITVSAWVNPKNLTDWDSVVSKSSTSSKNDGWGLTSYEDPNEIHFYINHWEDHNVKATLASGWSHVVGTYDGESINIYVNGVLENSTAYISTINHSSSVLSIGRNNGDAYSWQGNIDEVKIFAHAFTDADINTTYHNELAGFNWDGTVRTPVSCSALNNIVAEYKMDECFWNGVANEVLDASGNSLHGTAYNSANTIADAKVGRSGIFDASEASYVSVNHNDLLNPVGDFSVSTWFKAKSYSTWNGVFSKLEDGSSELNKKDGWNIQAGTGFDIASLQGNTSTGWAYLQSTTTPQTDQWYHAVMVHSANESKLYINGISERTINRTIEHNSGPLQIARFYTDLNTLTFDGQIDESKIFHGALTDTEVQEIYSNENTGLNWDGTVRVQPTCVVPNLSISDVSEEEKDSGSTAFTFNLRLDTAPLTAVSVFYTVDDGINAIAPMGSATVADNDYVSNSNIIEFGLGQTEANITVNVVGDMRMEPNEEFYVNLTAPQRLNLADTQARGIIKNDDLVSFSVERTDSNAPEFIAPTSEYDFKRKQQFYTQITNQDFDYSIVSYEKNTTDHHEADIQDLTLKIELYDKNSTTPNDILYTHYAYFDNNAKSRIIFDTNKFDLQIAQATRRAQFKITALLDANGSLLYGQYNNDADFTNAQNTLSTQEIEGQSDDFAIRPLAYRVKIQENNTTYKINDSDNTNVHLAAEYDYKLSVDASMDNSDSLANTYKTLNSQELNATLIFEDKSTCHQTNNITDMAINNNYNFIDGSLQNAEISHNNVGKYTFHITDINWTNTDIDSNGDSELSGCIFNSSSNTLVNNRYGCNFSSNTPNSSNYNPLNIEYEAYEFNLTNTSLENIHNSPESYLYMGDLNLSQKMGVNLFTDIIAQGEKHTPLSNFTNSCASKPVNLNLNYIITTDSLDNNTTYPELLTYHNTVQSFKRIISLNGDTPFNVEETHLSDIYTLPANAFLDVNEGNSSINILYNISKELNETMNPIHVNLLSIEANATESTFKMQDNNETAKEADSTGEIPNGERDFYYSRVAPDMENYPESYELNQTTPLGVEFFCDLNVAWCSQALPSTVALNSKHTKYGWYTVKRHNTTRDGTITQLVPNSPDVNIHPSDTNLTINRGKYGNVITEYMGNALNNKVTQRVGVEVMVNVDPWLQYHADITRNGNPFYRVTYKNPNFGILSGVGESGNMLNMNANEKASNRMSW
ncbi:MAG: internalin, putative [uncultured Sulfurovum sp.]|uniref:Internalin, putative n=1 Tax=uncultured Sulfurovum sp. TaxID=269237 RepID=A0A6S6TZT0_9BACT|nr:MAG: internalin, putative [uncultured Sulfurovum sp.]